EDPSNNEARRRLRLHGAAPAADHLATPMAEGGAACGHQGGSEPTVLSGAWRGKACKGFAPPGGGGGGCGTRRRETRGGGGEGRGGDPGEIGGGYGGGLSRRHAATVPGALPQRGARERGVGLDT